MLALVDVWSLPGTDVAVLLVAAFGAGVLDASVGSGGVVLLPALLAVAPAGTAAVPLAVNKAVAVLGNLAAAVRYRRTRPPIPGGTVLLAYIGLGLLALSAGVYTASHLTVSDITPLVVVALLALAGYTIWLAFQESGNEFSAGAVSGLRKRVLSGFVAAIGFYDGLIGPATGSLLQTALSRVLRRPVHECLSDARAIQGAFNLASATLLWIVARPSWELVLILSAANIVGSLGGTALAARFSDFRLRLLLAGCVAASAIRLLTLG